MVNSNVNWVISEAQVSRKLPGIGPVFLLIWQGSVEWRDDVSSHFGFAMTLIARRLRCFL